MERSIRSKWNNKYFFSYSKKDIEDLSSVDGLGFLKRLNPVKYRYNLDNENDPLRYGLLAEELKQTCLDCNMTFRGLHESKEIDEKTNEEKTTLGICYSDFIASLIKATQELDAKNNDLETRIQQQDAKIQELRTTNKELGDRITALEKKLA